MDIGKKESEIASAQFDFFQDHSKRFLLMALGGEKCGRLQNPDGYGRRTGDCGDTVEIFLRVHENIIHALTYAVDGCINTQACCNTVAHMAEGKRVEDAWEINPGDVIDYLETLPPDHEHCAELSVGALYRALSDFQENRRSPWKKIYGGS